jgi:hypothetical protein
MSFDMDDISGTASRSELFKDLKEERTVFVLSWSVWLYGRGSKLFNLVHQRLKFGRNGWSQESLCVSEEEQPELHSPLLEQCFEDPEYEN